MLIVAVSQIDSTNHKEGHTYLSSVKSLDTLNSIYTRKKKTINKMTG